MDLIDGYDDEPATDDVRYTSTAPLLSSAHAITVKAAPDVLAAVVPKAQTGLNAIQKQGDSLIVMRNLPADQMWAQTSGPFQPHAVKHFSSDLNRTIIGATETEHLDHASFEQQYRQYASRGFAAHPQGLGYVGDPTRMARLQAAASVQALDPRIPGDGTTSGSAAGVHAGNSGVGAESSVPPAYERRRRVAGAASAADVDGWAGPWSGYEKEADERVTALMSGQLTERQKKIRLDMGYNPDRAGKLGAEAAGPSDQSGGRGPSSGQGAAPGPNPAAAGSGAGADGSEPDGGEPTDEGGVARKQPTPYDSGAGGVGARAAGAGGAEEEDGGGGVSSAVATAAIAEAEAMGKEAAPSGAGVRADKTQTIFHGKALVDYQGRSWIEPPSGLRPDDGDHDCFLPKKCVHKYTGHNKGVQCIQFFPGTGHLLLSGSMDARVKVWDATGEHGYQVRRTYMGHTAAVRDAAFDLTGHRFVTASYDRDIKIWDTETGSCALNIPHGKVPYCAVWHPTDEHIFVVGSSNRKINQFDVRVGPDVVLEYDYHLSSVNSVVFFDNGRRFASSSDDKKVLIWDYNAPSPIKYISDPELHAIPAMTLHPSGEFFVGQAMNNQLLVFHCGERVGWNRKKRFGGHVTAGYACRPAFSANGANLLSGDGQGQVWCWDWKTGRMLKKFRAHDGGPAVGVAWHPVYPSTVATCGWDGLVKLWA